MWAQAQCNTFLDVWLQPLPLTKQSKAKSRIIQQCVVHPKTATVKKNVQLVRVAGLQLRFGVMQPRKPTDAGAHAASAWVMVYARRFCSPKGCIC